MSWMLWGGEKSIWNGFTPNQSTKLGWAVECSLQALSGSRISLSDTTTEVDALWRRVVAVMVSVTRSCTCTSWEHQLMSGVALLQHT